MGLELGGFDLEAITGVVVHDQVFERQHCIAVMTSKRTYYLSLDDAESAESWKCSILAQVSKLSLKCVGFYH